MVETKNPVKQDATWLTAAQDIYGIYEVEYPNFFVPNVFNVATDGNELRVGTVRSEPNDQSWSLWGSTELSPTLVGPKRTEQAAKRLLTPESVLILLETFTLFRHPTSATDLMTRVVACYPHRGRGGDPRRGLSRWVRQREAYTWFTETGRVSRARGLG